MLKLSPRGGDLLLLSWLPDGSGSSLDAICTELTEAAAARGAVLLGQRIFASRDALRVMVARCRCSARLAGRRRPPSSVIGVSACAAGTVAGVQAVAVVSECAPTPIEAAGEIVGRVVRGAAAEYLMLNDPGRALPAVGDPAAETAHTLALAEELLHGSGWTFAQVRRTWFSLHRILEWYDEFNRTRNKVFELRGHDRDSGAQPIPASTAIAGSNARGSWCTLDLVAVRPVAGGELGVRRLRNPMQNEATEYGSAFSRGLELVAGDTRQLWVSGTAAIDREGRSVGAGDFAGQVRATLGNVAALLGGAGATLDDICQATAFVKHAADVAQLRRVLRELGADHLPAVCAIADVCREDLLFELDATAIRSGHEPCGVAVEPDSSPL